MTFTRFITRSAFRNRLRSLLTVSSIAFSLLLLLVGSDILDRLAKRAVKQKVGRNLDDVSNFDRFVRCIGARRNINIWILIAALALGDAANGFVLICGWGTATALAHIVRAIQIHCSHGPVGRSANSP